MLKFGFIELEDNVIVYDNVNHNFVVSVNTVHDADLLCTLLNELDKRLDYYNRVIDKCIRNEKKYNQMIQDNKIQLDILSQENNILRNIIYEAEY